MLAPTLLGYFRRVAFHLIGPQDVALYAEKRGQIQYTLGILKGTGYFFVPSYRFTAR